MEELADDVGSGSDAEDDGAEDLLPPWQQQHWVLSPATVSPCPISLYQAYGAVTFLPVTLGVGEVVTVIYRGEKQKSVNRVLFQQIPFPLPHTRVALRSMSKYI